MAVLEPAKETLRHSPRKEDFVDYLVKPPGTQNPGTAKLTGCAAGSTHGQASSSAQKLIVCATLMGHRAPMDREHDWRYEPYPGADSHRQSEIEYGPATGGRFVVEDVEDVADADEDEEDYGEY
ncbi:hypothetical protein DL767_001315 [Monosporascus sp. MG133]|nr:hypothetical protein DL767_001315 [Monosporascus sp. MG133]